jgi:hypothetical protein
MKATLPGMPAAFVTVAANARIAARTAILGRTLLPFCAAFDYHALGRCNKLGMRLHAGRVRMTLATVL